MAGGLTLQQLQAMGAKPAAPPTGLTAEQLGLQQNHLDGFQTVDNRDVLAKVSDFLTTHNIPGAQIGQSIGTSVGSLVGALPFILKGDISTAKAVLASGADQNNANVGRVAGDVVTSTSLPASLGLAAPASLAGSSVQYGGLSAAQALGGDLTAGKDAKTTAIDTGLAGLVGAATGPVFNLFGRATEAAGPSALSFTSGVPKNAIEQAAANPAAAKSGLDMTVAQVRSKAVASLQGLYKDLGSEFSQGLEQLKEGTAALNPQELVSTALTKAQDFTEQLGVQFEPSAEGLKAVFDKSAIVKPAEQHAVQAALDTLGNWEDFSAAGIQKLSERIGALRNFDSSGVTRSSAIVGKIYNAVGDAIKEHYPQLAQLRTNYASNRSVLDEIGNVLAATKSKPTQIQASISRLDNLFAQNRDEYLNAIKQLGDRSGVDFLSLLAGGEFQKVLPGFVRGLGGGGAVGVGASLLNPYLLLLAPLFSPRVAGVIARNAPTIAKITSPLVRAATAQAIPALTQQPGSE